MITVGMNYHVIEGKQASFEAAFNKVIAALEAAPGHDNSQLYVDVNDRQSYCIISQWNDEAARKQLLKLFEAWGAMDPATVAARRKLSSLLFS